MANKGNFLDLLSKDNSNTDTVQSDNNSNNFNIPSRYRFASKSIPTTETHYNNDNSNIGIALIFNHYKFLGHEEINRSGTDYDTKCIKNSLENYGFDVRLYQDLISDEIDEIIKNVSRENHTENDCLVVVVMTHGKNGELSAYDKYYPIENIWTPFFGDKCKSLINKPKLFFIQACRGSGLEKPVEYKDNHSSGSELIPSINKKDTTKTFIIPNSADILIMYSCYEGKKSCRHTTNGTWFIQSISQLLNQYSTILSGIDLYNFLTLVNQKVAYEYETDILDGENVNMIKQMPNFTSTLTKLFIIKSKVQK